MAKYTYHRVDQIVSKDNINKFLTDAVDGGKIIYYTEFPAHPEHHLRVQIVIEKEEKTKTKSKLFG